MIDDFILGVHCGASDSIESRQFPTAIGGKAGLLFGYVLTLCALPCVALAENIKWEQLADGVAVSVWNPGETCPAVPSLLAIEIDPDLARFAIHHYAQEKLAQPPTIEEWQKRTGHDVIFNAGLFRENFAYLGLLYKDGRPLGSRRHTIWQGVFVAEPLASGVQKARVLDLAVEDFDEQHPPYQEAAQALMLLDQNGKIRVRQTGKQAYQTIIAETDKGRILIFKSRDVTSLYDIGRCLRDTLSGVRQAMAMDGGSSSDVLVSESLWPRDQQNENRVFWKALFGGSTFAHIPLPTVIGVSRR